MYSLKHEQPKVVKGLSSMLFTVKTWVEIAICEDEKVLRDYAQKVMTEYDVWKIEPR